MFLSYEQSPDLVGDLERDEDGLDEEEAGQQPEEDGLELLATWKEEIRVAAPEDVFDWVIKGSDRVEPRKSRIL